MTTYTTKQGDMWDIIALQQCGTRSAVDLLMRYNTAYIEYYIFPAGIKLTIPDIDKGRTRHAVPPWKRDA